jgi:hypothetical protein
LMSVQDFPEWEDTITCTVRYRLLRIRERSTWWVCFIFLREILSWFWVKIEEFLTI